MSALWRLSKTAIVHDVLKELNENPPRDYRTIQTLLLRCVEKGWVEKTAVGHRAHYKPKISWERGLRERTAEFLGEVRLLEERSLEIVQTALDAEMKGRKRGSKGSRSRSGRKN